jgi:ribosome-binding factor A
MKFDRDRNRPRGGRGPARFAGPELYFGNCRHEKPEHHTQALCKQVLRALSMILGGEVSDETIQSLMVMDVTPAPNAGRLLVTLASRSAIHLPAVLTRLELLRGFLRTRVAESITRKRAPELVFVIVPLSPPTSPEAEEVHRD